MIRLPSWVMALVAMAVVSAHPFVSGAASDALLFLAPLSVAAVYVRGRRDVDEMRESRDSAVEAWHRTCVHLDKIRREGRR